MKTKILILTLIIVFSMSLWAGRYAGDFMTIGAGVRSLGMGGAFSSVADDCTAIYWNASGISQIRNTQVAVMRAFLYQGLASYDNFSAVQPLPNEVSIGLNWTRLTIADIPVYLEEHLRYNVDKRSSFPEFNLTGIPDGKFSSTDDLFQFAFAKHLHYSLNMGWLFFELPFDFYFGGNIKYIKRKILNNLGTGTGFDFSFISRTDLSVLFDIEWLGYISFGMNFQDVGGTIVTWDVESNHEDEILFNNKVGVSIMQPLKFINSLLILSKDTDYVYGGTSHYGLEFQYKKFLSFRTGYFENNFSAGLGIKFYDFTLDYAFITHDLGNTNRVGLKVDF